MSFTEMAQFIGLSLRHNRGFKWYTRSTDATKVHVKGFAFRGGTMLRDEKLARMFAETALNRREPPREESFAGLLSNLNGSFAVVLQGGQWVFAGVDRMRSLPLFYGMTDSRVILSDDANWVKKHVGDVEADPLSVKEFMLTGYVTGSDTLFPRVKQLQAGEYLWCMTEHGRPLVKTHRYYRWIHGEYGDATEQELCSELDRMHLHIFERLLESTKGRTIVVPLSGGYDSRLIVAMLKRLGRDDVICFSYGKPGNKESKVSKCVADKLGYPWVFVPYSRERWRDWFLSDEWRRYAHYASGLCSIPHIQDWPAIWTLRDEGRIPDNAVLVPGHTAMLAIQANRVDRLMRDTQLQGADLFTTAIWDCHYALWRSDHDFLRGAFGGKLSAAACVPYTTADEVASALDLWAWQERHAKFIINSVRAYEFWGYEWRIPLWDNDAMTFWRNIPLALRVRRNLYRKGLLPLFEEHGVNIDPDERAKSGSWTESPLIRQVKYSPVLRPLAKTMHARIKWLKNYWTDPMAWHGTHTWKEHVKFALQRRSSIAGSSSINSFLVHSELQRLGIRDHACVSRLHGCV